MIKRVRHAAFVIGIAVAIGLSAPAYADDVRNAQWHLSFLRMAEANITSSGSGVIVGVVDTGADSKHPDLLGNVLPGKDLARISSDSNDSDGHGTGMAGLIAAHGHGPNNGALGVAPEAKVLPVKTGDFGVHAGGTEPDAIDWAVAHGAKVLCLAFGTRDYQELRESIDGAERADVVVVAAAGNSPEDTSVAWPAAYPGVVAVAAVGKDGNHASVSVTGPEIVLAAPGVDIVSTDKGGGYRKGTGTSDAAAIVAGVAALVRAKYPQLSAAEVIHRMTATAIDKGPPGRDDEYGYGIVNPVAALTADVPPLSPSATPTSQPTSADNHAQTVPSVRHGVSPWLVVAAVVLLVIGVVATWLLVQDRAREAADRDRGHEAVDHDSTREADEDDPRERADTPGG